MALLFLTLPPEEVDVNVHPAKSEVRFRDRNRTFGFLFAAVRQALQHGQPVAPANGPSIQPHAFTFQAPQAQPLPATFAPQQLRRGEVPAVAPAAEAVFIPPAPTATPLPAHALGAAVGQVDNTYIVAQTDDGGMVLVDQHAAHERLVYEQLKQAQAQGNIPRQPLLIPAVVNLTAMQVETLLAHAPDLEKLGLELEAFSPTAVAVSSLPAPLGAANPEPLVRDIVQELADFAPRTSLHSKLDQLLSTFACHHSIRAARRLSLEEMNALLRQMEANPATLTCNHGRPTTARFTPQSLARLFARS